MGNVIIQNDTTKNPIQMIGKYPGVCYGSNIESEKANYKRGIKCLQDGHFRAAEFPDVYMIIDGYSARVIREFYTHIGGAPTRLQASTRYIDYPNKGFGYILPQTVLDNPEANKSYIECMTKIQETGVILSSLGIPNEDIANILPLGMSTKMVCKINFRTLMDMSHQRLCTRAYWEFRALFVDIYNQLSAYSEEWDYLVKTYFMPKCLVCGFCTESECCGLSPKKDGN